MSKFRKKPVVIEAVQLSLGTKEKSAPIPPELNDFLFQSEAVADQWRWAEGGDAIIVTTLEGEMIARNGDWLIKGVKGELYPCKPDIFEATYEPVETTDHE